MTAIASPADDHPARDETAAVAGFPFRFPAPYSVREREMGSPVGPAPSAAPVTLKCPEHQPIKLRDRAYLAAI